MDDLVEIADDERSGRSSLSSSESSSSPGTSLPELEDQENIPPIDYENLNAILIPPPVGNPPPYAISGQHAVWSKGVPKSAFHPYHHPLAQLIQCSKAMAGRFHNGSLSRRATSTGSSPSSGGYRVVHSGSDGKDQHRSSGRAGGLSLNLTGGGNGGSAGEEGSESLVDSSGRT